MANLQAFPTFPNTPAQCFVAAANTASDGSGTLVTLYTVGANGGIFYGIRAQNAQASVAASSAMVWRAFVTDASGANPTLYMEVAAAATTRSNTAIGYQTTVLAPEGFAGRMLKSGQLIQVCQSIFAGAQDKMSYEALCADF